MFPFSFRYKNMDGEAAYVYREVREGRSRFYETVCVFTVVNITSILDKITLFYSVRGTYI